MKVALCQFNPVVGAVSHNAQRLLEFAQESKQRGAEVMFAPEMALCGYPPKDWMGNADFQVACQTWLGWLAEHAPLPMVVGAPDYSSLRGAEGDVAIYPGLLRSARNDDQWFNAAILCDADQVQTVARKQLLPNYQVFDDKRYFQEGTYFPPLKKGGEGGFSWGITICEDAWNDEQFWSNRRYDVDPVYELVTRDNPDILVTIMASPFERGKSELREQMFAHMAKRYLKPVLVVGQVGANDGLVFDGGTLVFDAQGNVVQRVGRFEEDLIVCKM